MTFYGASISAHQTEGMNRQSDWWDFEHTVLAKRGIEPSGNGVDHWHRFREDINFLSDNGLQAFRFSIEWARIEPEEGRFDEDALAHYDEVIKYAKQNHLVICLTLWHFTLPQWASKRGGMMDKVVRERFLNFARLCGKRWGNDIDLWVTMNEPMVYLMEGYRHGHWPPQIQSRMKAMRMFGILRRLHHRAYRILKEAGIHHVGIAKSVISYLPGKRFSPRNLIQSFRNFIWNTAFFVSDWKMHDFIGINYYISTKFGDGKELERDDMGWIIRPDGLRFALEQFRGFKKPIYITENGIATEDDEKRIAYLSSHISAMHEARDSGLDVRGYFYWSLLDNFEWDKGYSKRFGLVEVDRMTMKRSAKRSLEEFGRMAAGGE